MRNDAPQESREGVAPVGWNLPQTDDSVAPIVCGSNDHHVLTPTKSTDPIRAPAFTTWFDEKTALRHLALHEKHGVCADAQGDVYQWGDGFEATTGKRAPTLTLRGKDIIHVEVSEDRVFALSASGSIYALPSQLSDRTDWPPPPSSSWYDVSRVWRSAPLQGVILLKTDSREKFTSIAAGRDHLLALTSQGRVYAHAFNLSSNASGQLGYRKLDVPDPSSSTPLDAPRIPIELIPKSLKDPFAKATPQTRRKPTEATEELNSAISGGLAINDKLFEIPSLREVTISQIAAGGRTSFALTDTGRALGWGNNENGQVGLGSNVMLDTITIPTEIVLSRGAPSKSQTSCLNITAGGDLACFTVERRDNKLGSTPLVDVLMCGNGQWGGLGNNMFNNSQGYPVRAKNVSGLIEYSEELHKVIAIRPYAVSVSPTGHVLLALDTLKEAGGGVGGRDLMVWGTNQASELGNEKRSSVAAPTHLASSEGGRVCGCCAYAENNAWNFTRLVCQPYLLLPSSIQRRHRETGRQSRSRPAGRVARGEGLVLVETMCYG